MPEFLLELSLTVGLATELFVQSLSKIYSCYKTEISVFFTLLLLLFEGCLIVLYQVQSIYSTERDKIIMYNELEMKEEKVVIVYFTVRVVLFVIGKIIIHIFRVFFNRVRFTVGGLFLML